MKIKLMNTAKVFSQKKTPKRIFNPLSISPQS